MENLHLSYDEVVNKIPYRNLVIMQKTSSMWLSAKYYVKCRMRTCSRIENLTSNAIQRRYIRSGRTGTAIGGCLFGSLG